jgi:MFS family permease
MVDPAVSAPPQPAAAAASAARIRWITKLLTAIDFLAVAIVVPLLSSYFRDLDISTERYSLMSSAYSLAQLVGGLLLGAASDRSRRGVLLLSFFGSAIGYFLIGTARSFTVLLISRVVVGLVKQTLTVCTALISENLDADKPGGRARELGHLSACATGSFVIGPVLGSLLYKQHRLLPPIVSASLFLLNSVLVLVLLPSSKAAAAANTAAAAAAATNAADTAKLAASQNGSSSSSDSSSSKSVKSIKERMHSLQSNLMGSCALRPCFVVVVAKLFNGFLMRSMDSSLIVGYFEDTWKVSCCLM